MAEGIPPGGFGGPQDFWWDYPRLLVKSVWDKRGMGRDAFIEAASILTDIGHPNPVEGVAEVWGALGADQPYRPGTQYLRTEGFDAARAAKLPAPPSAEDVSNARRLYDSGASAFPGTEAHAGSKPWGTRDPMHPARIQLEREQASRGMSEQRARFADRSAQSRVSSARSKLDDLAKSYGFQSMEDFELSKYEGRDPYTGKFSPTKAHLDMQASPEYGRLNIELDEARSQRSSAARRLSEQSFKSGQPASDPRDELRRELGQRRQAASSLTESPPGGSRAMVDRVPDLPPPKGVRYIDIEGSVRYMPTDRAGLLAEEARALAEIDAIHKHRGQLAMGHGFGSEGGPRSALQRGRELDQFWRDVDELERMPPKGAQKASWDALAKDPRYSSMPGSDWDIDTRMDSANERLRAARRGLRGPSGPRTEVDRLFNEVKQMVKDRDVSSRRGAFELIKGDKGFISGVAPTARSTAARGLSKAAKVVGPVGLGIDALAAYGRGARDFDDWMSQEEEFLTGLPGLVSPSELPPPAVLSPDRVKAVEATQGMAGVAPDTKSPNVTEQEVRAYISNKVAKGDKLPAWAQKITSMKNGRLSIKPVNPRTKARQEAAKSGAK